MVPFLCFIATVAVKRVNAASQYLEPDAAGLVRVWALTSRRPKCISSALLKATCSEDFRVSLLARVQDAGS